MIETLIVIGIILILAIIGTAVYQRGLVGARQMACAANLRQIASGLQQYAGDNDQRFPPWGPNPWTDQVRDYLPSDTIYGGSSNGKGIFMCPERVGREHVTHSSMYALNAFIYGWSVLPETYGDAIVRRSGVPKPSKTILAGDACWWRGVEIPFSQIQIDILPGIIWNASPKENPKLGDHGNGAANLLFVDGHVEYMRDVYELRKPEYSNKGENDLWNVIK